MSQVDDVSQIKRLRTFADDFRRAQAANTQPEAVVAAPKAPAKVEKAPEIKTPIVKEVPTKTSVVIPPPEVVAPKPTEKTFSILPHDPPPPSLAASTGSVTVVDDTPAIKDIRPAASAGNPPFHFIRESSAPETVLEKKPLPYKEEKKTSPTASSQKAEPEDTILPNPNRSNYYDRESILSDVDNIFHIPTEQGGEAGGSIVTDRKRKRQSLFKAIFASLADWFNDVTKKKVAETSTKTTAIAPASEREETIKEAAATGAIAPKDDYQVITKNLKEIVPREPVTPYTIKDLQPEEHTPRWTHLTEDEVGSKVPSTAAAPDNLPVAKEPEEIPEEIVGDDFNDMPAAPLHSSIKPSSVTRTPIQPVEEKPVVVVEATPPEVLTPNAPPPPAIEIETVDIPKPPATPVRPEARRPSTKTFAPAAPTRRSPLAVILVIIGAIVLGSATAWFLFKEPKVEDPVTVVTIASDIPAQHQLPVAIKSGVRLIDEITKTFVSAPPGLIHLYPTIPATDGTTRPATAAETISALQLNAPGSFLRSISNLTIGGLSSKEPFLLLRVQSFDASLSGMIAWEDTMSADLEPLFGLALKESQLNAQDRSGLRFVDVVIANRDVRILRDAAGNSRIIYSFIDRNTLIITTSESAFMEILPLVK